MFDETEAALVLVTEALGKLQTDRLDEGVFSGMIRQKCQKRISMKQKLNKMSKQQKSIFCQMLRPSIRVALAHGGGLNLPPPSSADAHWVVSPPCADIGIGIQFLRPVRILTWEGHPSPCPMPTCSGVGDLSAGPVSTRTGEGDLFPYSVPMHAGVLCRLTQDGGPPARPCAGVHSGGNVSSRPTPPHTGAGAYLLALC